MKHNINKIELFFNMLQRIFHHPLTWVLLFILAVIPIGISLYIGGIGGCDPAYYLLYVGKIAEGYIPYKTIALGYMPLWFYLMYALSAPFGISCYTPEYFLVIHYLFVCGDAILVYFITKYFSQNKYVASLSSWLFLMISMWAYGNLILLEMPCIFWGLLATVLILYHKEKSLYWFILYGLFVSFAFLTKQYGIGFFFLCGILVVFDERRWQKLFLYILGYLLPIVLCLSYWGKDLLDVIFSSYGTATAIEAGIERSFSSIILDVFQRLAYFFLRMMPALLGCYVMLCYEE